MNKHYLNYFMCRLVKPQCLLVLFSFLFLNSVSGSSKFSSIFYYVGQMILDPGVSINEISDGGEFIIFKGEAPNQSSAYLLAEKLFSSKMQQEFNFTDIVPFWEKNKFTFYLKKSELEKTDGDAVVITSPPSRDTSSEKFYLAGTCSNKIDNVRISGDLIGETKCIEGKWNIQFPSYKGNLNLIGVRAYQRLVNQKILMDVRSFIISKR